MRIGSGRAGPKRPRDADDSETEEPPAAEGMRMGDDDSETEEPAKAGDPAPAMASDTAPAESAGGTEVLKPRGDDDDTAGTAPVADGGGAAAVDDAAEEAVGDSVAEVMTEEGWDAVAEAVDDLDGADAAAEAAMGEPFAEAPPAVEEPAMEEPVVDDSTSTDAVIERALTIVSNRMNECTAGGLCKVVLCHSERVNQWMEPTGVVTRVDIAARSVDGHTCYTERPFRCTFSHDERKGGVSSMLNVNGEKGDYYRSCSFVVRDAGTDCDFFSSTFSVTNANRERVEGEVITSLSVECC